MMERGQIALEKAEATLLLALLLALALALLLALALALLAARLALLAAALTVGAAALAVALALAVHGTAGHLYSMRRLFFEGRRLQGPKVDERSFRPGGCTMTLTILLLDTETNGLPKNRFAPPSDFDAYPAILQLSWAIYTVDGSRLTSVKSRDIGVQLDPSIPWDAGAAKIHGITEVEARHGTPAIKALQDLGFALRDVDVVVAHNLAFDKPVLRAAGYSVGLRDLWPATIKEFCTMKECRDLVKLPATAAQAKYADLGPYKSPRLNELYAWLYGHMYDISGAVLHTAKSDTHCLAQCIAGLLRRGHLAEIDGTLRLTGTATATDTE